MSINIPTNEPLDVVRGDDIVFESILKEYINGTATVLNLTGATIYLTVRPICNYDTALIELVSPTNIDITDALAGAVDINFTPAKTNSVVPKNNYIHDIQVLLSTSRIVTVNIGPFNLICDITRPAP